MTLNIDQQKQQLRQQAKQARYQGLQSCPQSGQLICENLLATGIFRQPTKVSGFWPLADEIDTLPTLHTLHQQGHMMLLPIMQGATKPLLFGQWQPQDTLVKAAFDTQEPSPNAHQDIPLIMLTPLLAFDRRGFRLGYGGGFYDRTIAMLRSMQATSSQTNHAPLRTIGLALSTQEVEQVITDTFDLALDIIVTEKEVLYCTKP